MRWLLLVLACLGAISMFLLATASANTELFARRYDLLLVLNTALVVLLMLLVGYQLWRLSRNLKAGVFGSRLAVRLVLLFALVAVLPGALVYAVSVQFLGKSIESWFDVRVDRALDGGLNLGRNALDYLLKETGNKAGQIALTLAEPAPGSLSARLNRAAEQAGIFEAVLFSSTGNVLAVAGIGGSTAPPEPLPAQALRNARLQVPYARQEEAADGRLLLRVVTPVNSDDRLEPLKVLQVIEPVPKGLGLDVEKVRAGARDYQEISFTRQSLKRLYAVTLTLTLLLALTSALGLAVVLSERFSAPLGRLAEGTRAVAQGDFTRRQPVTSRDELGVLTESFNTMTAQLLEAQQKTEESRRATETTRAYLESILGNLSAGVLAFDDGYRLRTANASAAVILQQPLAELTDVPLAEWGRKLPALAPFAELVAERLSRQRRRALAEAGRALGGQPHAHASDARVALAREPGGRLRRGVRRRHRPRAGAARRGVGRGRSPAGARNQESADADPAVGGAAGAKARAEARRRRSGNPGARRADHHRAGCRDEAHGRRLRGLCAAAASGHHAARERRRPLARRARVVRQSAPARHIVPSARAALRSGRADPSPPGVPQSPAECDRRPVRIGRAALRYSPRGAEATKSRWRFPTAVPASPMRCSTAPSNPT